MEKSLSALYFALAMEKQGRDFFTSAAGRVSNPAAREMFQELADWEKNHQEYIQQQIDSLKQSGTWSEKAAGAVEAGKMGPKVFTDRGEGRGPEPALPVDEATSDLSALRMALFIEQDLLDFYSRAVENTDDIHGKKVFQNLADWEKGHRGLIETRYQALLQDFFAHMGFSPF